MESIINFLATGPKSTFDFRKEFGVYPRGKLRLLYEKSHVDKYIINRRVVWSLKEQEITESVKQDIINRFTEIVQEIESNPLSDELSQQLENIKGELGEITTPFVFKDLKLAGR